MHLQNIDWNEHKYIGLDIDETLADSMPYSLEQMHKRGKFLSFGYEDMIRFDWENLEGADMDRNALRDFWNEMQLETVKCIDNAQDIVRLLHQSKTLFAVTARNTEFHKEDTEAWISRYFSEIPKHHILFANHDAEHHTAKSYLCKHHNITLMVDDAWHNAVDLVENGITCILLEKPWNRAYTDTHPLLYRAKSWKEIINSFSSHVS